MTCFGHWHFQRCLRVWRIKPESEAKNAQIHPLTRLIRFSATSIFEICGSLERKIIYFPGMHAKSRSTLEPGDNVGFLILGYGYEESRRCRSFGLLPYCALTARLLLGNGVTVTSGSKCCLTGRASS